MSTDLFATKLVAYCEAVYGSEFCREPGVMNILYLEGCTVKANPLEFVANNDAPDRWNDVRLLILFNEMKVPDVHFAVPATCEPGASATKSLRAAKLGGVARISIGFHKEKWVTGFHKGAKTHPALVQCAPITVHRDRNKDFKRTGDVVTTDVVGLNQHGTRPGIRPLRVGDFSFACLVGKYWSEHLTFMERIKNDPREVAAPGKFKWSSTVVDFGKFSKFLNGDKGK